MNDLGPTPHERLDALRGRFRARAAGWWRVDAEGDRLEQVAFAADVDLPEDVAVGFAGATRSVAMDEANLGIVRAARSGVPVVSRADALPGESGSGLWLRRFGATRSVAVPVVDGSGAVARVVSLALNGNEDGDGDAAIVAAILAEAETWPWPWPIDPPCRRGPGAVS